MIVCGAGASSTFLASRMRVISRRDDLGLTISVAAISELATRMDGGFVDVVLVGPQLSSDFAAIEATVAGSGGVALLLASDAFGPDGAQSAIALVESRIPHSTEGIPRV